MSKFVKAAVVGELLPGERKYIEFEEEIILLLNVDGKYFAIADVCSHDGASLEDGEIEGCEIECPRHGARFDIRTGKVVSFPAVVDIPSFAVKIDGDEILVESPDEF